jgi:hypothetical protein
MPPKRKLEVESYKFISRGYRRSGGKNEYMFNDYLHELAREFPRPAQSTPFFTTTTTTK